MHIKKNLHALRPYSQVT